MAITSLAVLSFKTAAEIAADIAQFAPVPALAPACGILLGILRCCERVGTNKDEILQLRDRCLNLVRIIWASSEGLGPSKLTIAMDQCCAVLTDVQVKLERWSKLGSVQAFLRQKQISDDISEANTKLTVCLDELKLTALFGFHSWQADFDICKARDHGEITARLVDIAEKMDELKEAAQLENEEIRKFMAVMNQALDQLGAGDARHTTLATGIYRLQQESGVLPPTTALKSNVHVRRIGRYPVGGGPKCDIWEGQWLENEKVALKALRNSRFPPKERKRFQREVNIWRLVWEADKGKYILPFYGTVTDDGPYPLLVSPWQANGTAIEWVKKNTDDIDYIKLVLGIACGIRVLHDWDTPIVHGDLKGENILISDAGEPLLSDFGLSKILEDCTGTPFTQTKGISDSFRWFAPEIFHSGKLTTSSDIFSFSMTALELFTGMPPFSHIKQPPQVLIRMERGERPEKPTDSLVKARGLDDTLWEFLEKCWAQDPNARPSIQEVIQELTPPRYPLDTF